MKCDLWGWKGDDMDFHPSICCVMVISWMSLGLMDGSQLESRAALTSIEVGPTCLLFFPSILPLAIDNTQNQKLRY